MLDSLGEIAGGALYDAVNSLVDTAGQLLSGAIDAATFLSQMAGDGLNSIADAIGTTAQSLFDAAAAIPDDVLGYLDDNLPDWLDALAALFAGPNHDPLVIDLDGDGIELTALDGSTARFDLDGDGFAEQTGWVSPDDALLAVDLNGNGTIDDISELFGSDTQTGYEELAAYDSNGDGVINAQDSAFVSLLLWQDLNGNGVSDEGELISLTDANIETIGLTTTASNDMINGNQIDETGTVTFTDGTTTTSADVLLDISQVFSTYNLPDGFAYDEDVLTLPVLRGFGEISDLWVSMTQDAGLKAKVEGLIDDARAGNFATFLNGFEGMLTDWADVGDAVWLQDAGLEVHFTYDAQELTDYQIWQIAHPTVIVDGVVSGGEPYPGPTPQIVGYLFFPGGTFNTVDPVSPSEIEAWLEETDTLVPFYIDQSHSFWELPITTLNSPSTVVGSGHRHTWTVERLALGGGGSDTPDMEATQFAFLQRFMGQDYREATNYLAPEDVIVVTPGEADVVELIESYNDLRDYMTARFLAQSAWSIIASEGEGADLGGLAPFQNIFLDPFTDTILGNFSALAIELMNFSGPSGYDDVMKLLSVFQDHNDELAATIHINFPEIDPALIMQEFEVAFVDEGTGGNDNISASADGIIFGHDGDDTISSAGTDNAIVGGTGNDILAGGDGSTEYIYFDGDGSDTITDYDFLYQNGTDTFMFADVNAADVAFSHGATNDLIMTLSNGETVTINNHFDTDGDYAIETITFADGTTLDAQDTRDKTVSDMKATGVVTGSSLGENYVHNLGDGSYTITDYDGGTQSGTDTFIFTDANAADVTFGRGATNDLIMTQSNGETITVNNHFDTDGDYAIETITFADGTTLDAQGIQDEVAADYTAFHWDDV